MTTDREQLGRDLVRAFGIPYAVVGMHGPEIVEFIADRISDDEYTANAAADDHGTPTWVHVDGDNVTPHPSTGNSYVACGPWAGPIGPAGEHIAMHDPARVLAGVPVHRLMLELHTPGPDGDCRTCLAVAPCRTLRALAATWSGHLDYRQDWRP